jgi:hypothetical protein
MEHQAYFSSAKHRTLQVLDPAIQYAMSRDNSQEWAAALNNKYA